jgi:outer membrane protein TolC
MRVFSVKTWCVLGLVACALLGGGCTRKFYRTRTDDDIVGLLTQKNQFPQWGIQNWHIYPDPRSRFADTTNPDRPPKPPDDLAAYELSPDPQPRKKRWGYIEGNGYLSYMQAWDVENRERRRCREEQARAQAPASPATAEVRTTSNESFNKALGTEEKTFLINLEQSCELALFNSREFQDRREDLYGAALPVSAERFAFAAQFLGTEQAIREVAGSRTANPGNRWRLNSTGGVSKLFPSGATLVAQLANQLVVELGATGRPTVSLSNLSVQLTQPLLRGGGYAVTLEPLTQAERSLVYAVRSYARFRKVYYTYLAGGNNNIFNSPYSYAGLSLRGVGPTLTASGQGFYPTILLIALQRAETRNMLNLERYWKVFQAFEEGGDVSRLQVDQVEQQLLQSRSRLLQDRLNLQNGLDQFKLQLGLPTPLPLELDDSSIRPIDEHLDRFTQARVEFDEARREAGQMADAIRRPLLFLGGGGFSYVPIDVALRDRLRSLFTESRAVRGTEFRKRIIGRWAELEKLDDKEIQKRITAMRGRRDDLQERRARSEVEGGKFTTESETELNELLSKINLARFELAVRQYERKPWLNESGPRRQARDQANIFHEATDLFALVLGEAREERQREIRKTWPTLPGVTIEDVDLLGADLDKALTVAARTALANRFELMNARGQLVDSWRQVAVQANALMGILNVGYNLNTTSPAGSNQPLSLGDGRNTHQLVLNGALPLVRRAERNAYRTALISFQRQRRALMANEDFILSDVRTDLRTLRQLAESYRIQQRAVEVALAQVENSLEALAAPPDPRAAQQTNAGSAAALTLQLLNSQTSLLNAQNNLYTVWINYLINRMQFYRDIELLPLDPRGFWTDEYTSPESRPDRPAPGGAPGERLPEPEPVPQLPTAAPEWDVLRLPLGEGAGPRWQKSRP